MFDQTRHAGIMTVDWVEKHSYSSDHEVLLTDFEFVLFKLTVIGGTMYTSVHQLWACLKLNMTRKVMPIKGHQMGKK